MFKRNEYVSEYATASVNRDLYTFEDHFQYAHYVENSHVEKCKDDLCKSLKNDIVFTGAWSDNIDELQVSKEDLLPGEVLAVTFIIGCYTVRFAKRIYKELYTDPPMPANESEIESAGYRIGRGIYATYEVSARHNSNPDDAFADGFKYICKAIGYFTSSESIGCICAARDKDLIDERASLFVSFAVQGGYYIPYTRWYKLSPDGAVTTISASSNIE